MKSAENLAGVHTHTHTCSLDDKKIDKIIEDRNIKLVSRINTG